MTCWHFLAMPMSSDLAASRMRHNRTTLRLEHSSTSWASHAAIVTSRYARCLLRGFQAIRHPALCQILTSKITSNLPDSVRNVAELIDESERVGEVNFALFVFSERNDRHALGRN